MSGGIVFDVDDLDIVIVRETGDVLAEVADDPLRIETEAVGLPGVGGPAGPQGPQGAPGDAGADPGDFVLIFENHLI